MDDVPPIVPKWGQNIWDAVAASLLLQHRKYSVILYIFNVLGLEFITSSYELVAHHYHRCTKKIWITFSKTVPQSFLIKVVHWVYFILPRAQGSSWLSLRTCLFEDSIQSFTAKKGDLWMWGETRMLGLPSCEIYFINCYRINKSLNTLQTSNKLKDPLTWVTKKTLINSFLLSSCRITLALIGLSWLVIGTVLVGFLPDSRYRSQPQ